MAFVVVVTEANRRVADFQQALVDLGLPAATVVNYSDLLVGREDLTQHWQPGACLRFESPERDDELEREILASGYAEDPGGRHERLSPAQLKQLEDEKGQLRCPRQWYLGFRALLRQWVYLWPGACMNHPDDIAVMFDKRLCQERLARGGVPIPASLGPIRNYDHLRECMHVGGYERVFVKLAYGSAAAGVVAYQLLPQGETATTTLELERSHGIRFYNSRLIRHYSRRSDIRTIIDWLCAEGAQVEQWLPRATVEDGRGFDLRVVVIGGRACHTVMRVSHSPMTNLRLGGSRGDLERFVQSVGESAWSAMQRTCEQAAALFPRSHYCGVDLLVASNQKDHFVLEVNAFGDLLPGITWGGQSTYAAEIAAWQTSSGGMPCAI
jgi:hypothetical protein